MYDYVLMMFYDHIMGMSQNQLPHATPKKNRMVDLVDDDCPTVAMIK
jgi:hypothetical protein